MDHDQNLELKKIYDDQGNALSPILPEGVKNYLIDIDGTICDDVPNEQPERMRHIEPYADALEIINKWTDQGQEDRRPISPLPEKPLPKAGICAKPPNA